MKLLTRKRIADTSVNETCLSTKYSSVPSDAVSNALMQSPMLSDLVPLCMAEQRVMEMQILKAVHVWLDVGHARWSRSNMLADHPDTDPCGLNR